MIPPTKAAPTRVSMTVKRAIRRAVRCRIGKYTSLSSSASQHRCRSPSRLCALPSAIADSILPDRKYRDFGRRHPVRRAICRNRSSSRSAWEPIQ